MRQGSALTCMHARGTPAMELECTAQTASCRQQPDEAPLAGPPLLQLCNLSAAMHLLRSP